MPHEGRLLAVFVRDYEKMEELARNLEVDGLTNYQKALKDALTEFALPGLGSKNKHLLFLTDGAPTQGCAELEEEQRWAKRLGVAIHVVFIGEGEYPPVLDSLALGTGGARFQAVPEYDTGVIRLHDRSEGELPPWVAPPIDAMAMEMARERAVQQMGTEAAKAAVGGPRFRGASDQKPQQMPGVPLDTTAGGPASPAPGEGGLQKSEEPDASAMTEEQREEALRKLALGRSPISGNAVTRRGRFEA